MGNFFTSTQIYDNEKLSKEQFIDNFCKKMSEDGYVTCGNDESELSYILRFADNCKWVTITSEAYEQGNALSHKDAGRIAKMLGTTCVNTVVIDSDCAIMELYNEKGQKADTLTIGRADDYLGDDIPQPTEKIWEPFLSNGSTWNRFIEICSEDEVFVEDSLSELAPVIGMDSSNILFSNDHALEDDQLFFLNFRKTGSKKGNHFTFSDAFDINIGSELEKRGFIKLKSRYPYYTRIINREIIHTITYVEEHSIYKNQKSFKILSGIGTIYRAKFDFSLSPKMNSNWLVNTFNVYRKLLICDDMFKYKNDNIDLYFNCSIDSQKLSEDMKQIFSVVDNVILYAMNKFNDIDSFIKNSELFDISMSIYEDDDFGKKWSGYSENEGLLYIMTDNKNAITDHHYREIKSVEKEIAVGKHPPIISHEVFWKNFEDGYNRQLNAFDIIRNSETLYSKALSEMEKRALKNKKKLLEYGLNI